MKHPGKQLLRAAPLTHPAQTIPRSLTAVTHCLAVESTASVNSAIDASVLGKTRYVRLTELRTMVPFSVATIWRKSRDGSFVPAIKISERVTVWNREAVEAWLAAKEAA